MGMRHSTRPGFAIAALLVPIVLAGCKGGGPEATAPDATATEATAAEEDTATWRVTGRV